MQITEYYLQQQMQEKPMLLTAMCGKRCDMKQCEIKTGELYYLVNGITQCENCHAEKVEEMENGKLQMANCKLWEGI